MQRYCSSKACLQGLIDELYFPFIDQELSLTKEMKAVVRRINKNADEHLPLYAKVVHEASEVKTPAIKLLAVTNKPGPNWIQSLRPFETADDLLKPDNLFCSPEKIIKLVGDDFRVVKLLNQTSQLIQATQRKLNKITKEL